MKKGFTLIEILVVIAVIGILGTMLLPNLNNMVERARQTKAEADVNTIYTAMTALHNDTGRWWGCSCWNGNCVNNPRGNTLNGLHYGLVNTDGSYPNWRGPYLVKPIGEHGNGHDPWGTLYYCDGCPRCERGVGQSCIGSAGADLTWRSYNQASLLPVGDDIVIYPHE